MPRVKGESVPIRAVIFKTAPYDDFYWMFNSVTEASEWLYEEGHSASINAAKVAISTEINKRKNHRYKELFIFYGDCEQQAIEQMNAVCNMLCSNEPRPKNTVMRRTYS